MKNDKGWGYRTDNTLSAEIKYAGQIRKVHFSQFAIPLALSILTFLVACLQPKEELKEVKLILVGTFAILTGLFYLTAVLMDRQKTKIISLDSDVNIGYARSRKNIWKKLWLAYAWMNAVFTIGVLLSYRFGLHQFAVFLAEMFVYCIAFLIVLLLMIKRLKKVESSYENKMDYNFFEDDDLWIGGLIYYNPKDKHAMVEARVGMGNAVNMARPGGKCLAASLGIMILGVLLSGVWVIMLEFLPIHLSVKEDTLIAAQIRNDYVIQADKMESLSLLTELPHWSKTSGTNMDNLEKGTFHIPEQGRCQVFLNPQNQLFIKFDVNGTTYYMSGENDEETKEVYDKLAGF